MATSPLTPGLAPHATDQIDIIAGTPSVAPAGVARLSFQDGALAVSVDGADAAPVGGVTSSSQVILPNASGTNVVAAEDDTALSTLTAGAEVAQRVFRMIKAGARVVSAVFSGDGIMLPQGAGAGLQFQPGAGARSGIGYDTLGPYLTYWINSATRFWRHYTNLIMFDTASATGGIAFDTSLAGGVYFSGSGSSVTLRSTTIDGIEATISGATVWGRIVNSGSSVAAARIVTVNSSGLGIVADATTPTRCLGVTVAGAGASANLRFVIAGLAAGVLSAATPGTPYYLGASGALTTSRNTTSGQAQIQVGHAFSATDLYVQISDRGLNP